MRERARVCLAKVLPRLILPLKELASKPMPARPQNNAGNCENRIWDPEDHGTDRKLKHPKMHRRENAKYGARNVAIALRDK